MTLKELAARGVRYHLTLQMQSPLKQEKIVNGEEILDITYNVLVDILVYDPNDLTGPNKESTVVAKVQATGSGKTQRLAERDAIRECLRRIAL